MSLPVVFQPDAQEEMDHAYAWYEGQRPGLGEAFLAAVREVLTRIQEHPEMYEQLYRGLRRGLTRRFPYAIFYRVEANRIVVVAVFHSSRDPQEWQYRA